MTAVLADLALEAEAALLLVMRVAAAFDASAPTAERRCSRIGAAIAKYWVTKRLPDHAYEALECLGGNGYVEEGPMARLYREAPVNAIWEGSGNVNASTSCGPWRASRVRWRLGAARRGPRAASTPHSIASSTAWMPRSSILPKRSPERASSSRPWHSRCRAL